MDCFPCLLCKSRIGKSSLYRKGIKKVHEGRYFDSDIIFRQVLHEHPAQEFWMKVHNGVRQMDLVDFPDPPHETLGKGIKDTEVNRYEMIEFSFDTRLAQAVDFIRTCMDIANAYLNQPENEINTKIAMCYYAFTITYLLEFLHLMMLWKSEVGEALLSQSDSANNPTDKYFATPHDIMQVFKHTKHLAIFYFVSATLCYTMLSVQYIHRLDGSKEKLKTRILNNCLELVNSVHYVMRRLALLMPESPTAQVFLEKMPGLEFSIYEEPEEDEEKSTACRTESSCPRSKIQSIKGGWSVIVDDISRNRGVDSFFFQLKRIHPGMRIVRELPKNPRVRFLIPTKLPRNRLAHIEPPTERNAFHYISCFLTEYVTIIPGQSVHYLARELPERFGIDGQFPLKQTVGDAVKPHTNPMESPKGCGTIAVNFKSDSVAHQLSTPGTNHNVFRRKTSVRVVESIRRHLNLNDLRMLAVVCLEELMLVGAPMWVVTAYLLEEMGRHERAMEFIRLMTLCADVMYGVDSFEYSLLISLRDLCTIKL
ncbi:unnamed protein product [Phytomonas sp. EM1]|nr:unnamed protein product [Phytomonas sp. EM1]|eukprot:CCW65403.1 unnamed protein product [Phytomonas sp. isolate EM1]